MIDYHAILDKRSLRHLVGAVNGDTYEGIRWKGEPIPKEELDALWPEVQAELHAERIQRERQAAHHAEADPIRYDALEMEKCLALTVDFKGQTVTQEMVDAKWVEWLEKKAEIRERIK